MPSRETFLNGCIAGYNRDISSVAFRRLLKEYRTTEGKTELFEAAWDSLKNGRHDGPCSFRDDGACSIHLENRRARMDRLESAIRQRVNAVGEKLKYISGPLGRIHA